MSSDNFYFVDEDNVVWMGFASEWEEFYDKMAAKMQRKFAARIKKHSRPQYRGKDREDAVDWAHREYSEYGLWWVEGEE